MTRPHEHQHAHEYAAPPSRVFELPRDGSASPTSPPPRAASATASGVRRRLIAALITGVLATLLATGGYALLPDAVKAGLHDGFREPSTQRSP